MRSRVAVLALLAAVLCCVDGKMHRASRDEPERGQFHLGAAHQEVSHNAKLCRAQATARCEGEADLDICRTCLYDKCMEEPIDEQGCQRPLLPPAEEEVEAEASGPSAAELLASAQDGQAYLEAREKQEEELLKEAHKASGRVPEPWKWQRGNDFFTLSNPELEQVYSSQIDE